MCLISTKGDGWYDSFIIGDGVTEAKNLSLVPYNPPESSSFLGIIPPSFIPGTPRTSVYYLASGPGEYHGFGNIRVEKGEVAFIQWVRGGWSKISVTPILVDSELSETSDNPVQNKVLTKKLGELDRLMVKGIKMSGSSLTKDDEGVIEIPVDENLSEESRNPVQNKAVTTKIATLDDWFLC